MKDSITSWLTKLYNSFFHIEQMAEMPSIIYEDAVTVGTMITTTTYMCYCADEPTVVATDAKWKIKKIVETVDTSVAGTITTRSYFTWPGDKKYTHLGTYAGVAALTYVYLKD